MELQVALNQNIRFLLVEVEKQVTRTGHYLRQPTPELAQKIYASDDYVDNLKTFVQAQCFSLAVEAGSSDESPDSGWPWGWRVRTSPALASCWTSRSSARCT
jgi:hypothetical protein